MEHKIFRVEPGSIAEETGMEPGDVVVTVNDVQIEDVFDWRALTEDENVTVLIRKPDGEEWELEIEKEPYEDMGVVFESDLMSDYRRCANACIFCFIDQMPPGMRDTLYFKDDDSRLSFLQGNYITLTNMSRHDVDRIIRYRMEPMNISVHTTNPELRCRMLKNRNAGKVLGYLDDFYNAGLHMNGQIVLCKGWNDGKELERTLSDLYRYVPFLESLSVVPVGLTKYREGLTRLSPLTKEDARETIALVERWQRKAFAEYGIHYVHASDEIYITAGLPFPEAEVYDGYLQIENGVGMVRSLLDEADEELASLKKEGPAMELSFATGALAGTILNEVSSRVSARFPGRQNRVYSIRNDFFGETVTVAGLVTGADLIAQLRGKDLGDILLIPGAMLRSGEDVFLDDVRVPEAEEALGVPIRVLKGGGGPLVRAMCGLLNEDDFDSTHGEYELK